MTGGATCLDFNPRSPYGERHRIKAKINNITISIHAPHTGSDAAVTLSELACLISIHAPHTGSDLFRFFCGCNNGISIHAPHTGSDGQSFEPDASKAISIHAPHTGSDPLQHRFLRLRTDFNPRSPYGERRISVDTMYSLFEFQSTLPIRGATHIATHMRLNDIISIHAPHTGSDLIFVHTL